MSKTPSRPVYADGFIGPQEPHFIINLPFPGFYNTWLDGEFDNIAEREVEYFPERQEEEKIPEEQRLTEAEYGEILFDCSDFGEMHEAVAAAYCDAFGNEASDLLGVSLGLKFECMTSPKFYNFETDRLFAHIPERVMRTLLAEHIEPSHLQAVIKERFTSYDGFHSHYSNDLEDWDKPLDEMDHNELGTLLLAALAQFDQDDLGERLLLAVIDGDGLYQEWSNNVDWTKVDAKVAELRADKLDKLEEAVEAGEAEPPLPERCPFTLDLFDR